jgi:dTMP kinase
MARRRGRFVVLEGLSAVGKTTVAPIAARLLGAELIPTLPPWLAETRLRIDATLVATARLHFWMMCNYAAADVIEATLTAGRDVVVESYFYRTLATHTAIGVGSLPGIDWRAAPYPDLALLLTVDETVRQERLDLRRGTNKYTHWTSSEETDVAATVAAYASFGLPAVDTTGLTPTEVAGEVALLLSRTVLQHSDRRGDIRHA